MPNKTIPIITRTDTAPVVTHATPEAVQAWLAQERYAADVERTLTAVQHRIGPCGEGEEQHE